MTRNGGEDRWQELSKPYEHEELGITMHGLGIYDNDDILRFYCDKSKADNLRSRVVDRSAMHVVIPVIGTPERNDRYHLAMKGALQNRIIRFPEDEMTAKDKLRESGEYSTMTPNERMRKLLPNVQHDIMIIDEAIKLQQVINKGFISLVTSGRNKRDRIVACEYANYFFHLLELDMIKRQQQPDWDIRDWQLWSNNK